jgi:hypothetical protein
VLITIEELQRWFKEDSATLVSRLQEETGRYGSEESNAWRRSLQTLTTVFRAPSFKPVHLYFERRGNLALEYQLPAASSWADVVLLGRHESEHAAVIVELKDWTTTADRPGKAEGLIERTGRQELHPSDQVRGYSEYCRRFHSAIDEKSNVAGCVLFTHQVYTDAYTRAPNEQLTRNYPIFTTASEDVDNRFPAFFRTRLTEPDEDFAIRFATGHYRQQRGFVAQIGAQILNPESSPFELLDNQRRAFALCEAVVDECFLSGSSTKPKKRVVVVKGPPGSGKSVIAARLWASLVTNKRLPEGDVVFTTTSLSQNSNWSYIFNQLAKEGGSGLIRKASIVTPLTPNALGRLRRIHGEAFMSDHSRWLENVQLLRDLGDGFHDGSRDDQNLVTVVDEAHSLINPEHRSGRGKFGFSTSLGPQAYHIIRTSQLTIFLLDPEQGFRERENTTLEDIMKWAQELGAGKPEVINLEGAQFRCAGSAEYVNWLEFVLQGAPASRNQVLASAWQREPVADAAANIIDFETEIQKRDLARAAEEAPPFRVVRRPYVPGFEFKIVDSPVELERELRQRVQQGNSVRLLSSYSREWKTVDATAPHHLPASMQDFCETYVENGQSKIWARPWNFVPRGGTDYTAFVRAAPGSKMADDPLSEVGCPYAVRGFDYDYVGILWLNDLIWRKDHWEIDAAAVHERGIMQLARLARREQTRDGPATGELLKRTLQAYRILFTRALKGAYVWIADRETCEYIKASLCPAE